MSPGVATSASTSSSTFSSAITADARSAVGSAPERLELIEKGLGVSRAERGILLEELRYEVVGLTGDPSSGRALTGELGLFDQMRDDHVRRAVGDERRLPGEELEEHRTEGVNVGSRVPGLAAGDLGGHRLRRDEEAEDPALAARSAGDSRAKLVRTRVDQDDTWLALRPPRQDDVLELQATVHEPGPMERAERLEDSPENPFQLVHVRRAALREPGRERLPLDPLVRHPRRPIRELPSLQLPRETVMLHARDDAVRGQESMRRPAIARDLAPEDLEDAEPVVAARLVDDRVIALADLPLDRERPERLPCRQLLPSEERVDVAHARVDFASFEQDDVDERVEPFSVEASLRQRARKAPFRRRPTDLGGVEAEEPPRSSQSSRRG